jgi:N-acetylmuramoyl-L-alanine amidase
MDGGRGSIAALMGLLALGSVALAGCTETNKANSPEVEPQAHAQNAPPSGGPKEPIGAERNGIRLVYPHDGSSIPAPSTYMTGAVAPGTVLTVNGLPVRVNAQGFFAQVLPLAIGANQFNVVANADPARNFAFAVNRPAPPKPVPENPVQILKGSMEPRQDLGGQPGDIIVFSMKGSPGGKASVQLGGRVIPLGAGGTGKVNLGLDTTFGVQFQKSAGGAKDLYSGFYRLSPTDSFQNTRPEFILVKNGITVRSKAPGTVSMISQPFIAVTKEDNTIVRVGPGAGRTTPFTQGVRMMVDGFYGDSYRCEVAPNKHLWIEKSEMVRDEAPGLPPTGTVRTINIENEGDNGARVVVPLNQRLPYEVRQEVSPYNKLILKVYGATADTDWVTEPTTSSNAVEQADKNPQPHGSAMPNKSDRARNPVSYVTWQQLSDRVYQIQVNIASKAQWGWWVDYEGSNMVLHVKGAPNVALSQNSLAGLRICIDPGHGGRETGAIGCSGIKESTMNLGIGLKVERILRELGAEVIMTRKTDIDVSLGDRVATAVAARADLLLSIHNNSLPDGRNPWTEHGTSSYYYHPQSRIYANDIRSGTVESVGFPDYNTRWQNLALCRPSQMPACLVEVGFVINPDEYAALISDEGQERAARGIAGGVRNFLSQSLGVTPASPQN